MSEQNASKIIGSVADFESFPAQVKVDNQPHYIVEAPRNGEEPQRYNLISAICPHAGGMVRPHLNELICPLHYWCFDLARRIHQYPRRTAGLRAARHSGRAVCDQSLNCAKGARATNNCIMKNRAMKNCAIEEARK